MVRSLSLPKRRLHIVIPGLTGNLLLQSARFKSRVFLFCIVNQFENNVYSKYHNISETRTKIKLLFIILLFVCFTSAQDYCTKAVIDYATQLNQNQIVIKGNQDLMMTYLTNIESHQKLMQQIIMRMEKDLFDTKMKIYDLQAQNDSLKAILQKKKK